MTPWSNNPIVDTVAREMVRQLAGTTFELAKSLRDMHYGELPNGVNAEAKDRVDELLNNLIELQIGRLNGETVV